MAKETVMAKLASRQKVKIRQRIGDCTCGGELVWAQVFAPKARMMKMCEKCGELYPRNGLNGRG